MREIPSIEQLRQRPAMRALEAQFGRDAVVQALRDEAAALRQAAAAGAALPDDVPGAIVEAVPRRLAAGGATSLRSVINATGVIIHTNLGRAPLGRGAAERAAAIAASYSNLEYELDSGERGNRDTHTNRLLCRLTGAEAALVVNNNAAATLLALAAVAAGREVIVSRGEMVEIGGGFRVPEVMLQSGAILREVGTTNRTRAADYAAAVNERTAAILRIHPSNFRIEGFVERPALAELVGIGRKLGVPVLEDLGSGYLGLKNAPEPLREEPCVRHSIEEGAELVMFSGDKLLGGPQAGIVAGSERLVAMVRKHPLMRALRADKMTYAALEWTLQEHAAGHAEDAIPVSQMMALTEAAIVLRAKRVTSQLPSGSLQIALISGSSTIGGGSAPGSRLPTQLIALKHHALSATELEARLRAADPPVIARIENDRVLLDLRTVLRDQDDILIETIAAVLQA